MSNTGRRNFGAFIADYATPIPGTFVDVASGAILGACPNLAAVTHGQGAGISGLPEKCAEAAPLLSCMQLLGMHAGRPLTTLAHAGCLWSGRICPGG